MIVATVINLNHPGHYIRWGFFQISLANFIVILLMTLAFVLALIIPFPKHEILEDDKSKADSSDKLSFQDSSSSEDSA